MPANEPDLAAVRSSVIELLAEQEMAALATLPASGYPSVSTMHIASDGLAVYVHTFTNNRKYDEMLRDPRVGYVASHVPSGGFAERRLIRSIQVKGSATLVTEPTELQRAVEVSRQQFAWLRESHLYDNLTVPAAHARQVFFRIDPVEALWTDHRLRQLWRTILTFTPDGRELAGMRPYQDVTVAST
jgi:nitroimidazol reductase NimA-like FMN-containing flavoprotein (pyridoxamine 5'-phosphate oxidase superfamily)